MLYSLAHQVKGCSMSGVMELLCGDVRARVDLWTEDLGGQVRKGARVSFEVVSLREVASKARWLRIRAEILRARACLLEDEATRIRLGVPARGARVSWFVAEVGGVGEGQVGIEVGVAEHASDHILIEGEDAWIVLGAIFGSSYEESVRDLHAFLASGDRDSMGERMEERST